MGRGPQGCRLTDTLFPYTTLFRSVSSAVPETGPPDGRVEGHRAEVRREIAEDDECGGGEGRRQDDRDVAREDGVVGHATHPGPSEEDRKSTRVNHSH